MIPDGKYIYCIIPTDEARHFGSIGIADRDVHNVNYKGLSAVISNVPLAKYELSSNLLITHQRVVEKVMQDYPVLPVRFYTVAESVKDILQFLELNSREFLNLFNELENKAEIGIEVFWKDMKKVYQEIVSENPQLKVEEIKDNFVKQNNLQKDQLIEVGKEVAKIIAQKKEKDAGSWLSGLKKLSYNYKILQPRTDNAVLNAAFLVSDMKRREFDSIVEELANKDRNYWEVKYIGPVPPYNFVNIKLDLNKGV